MGREKFWMRFALAALLLAAALACPALAQTELGVEHDFSVYGAGGTEADPNVEIKGFTVFGSTQAAYVGALVGPGNVVVNGVLSVSSGAYFVGNSTFTGANKIFVNDGSAGQILGKNAGGWLEWLSSGSLGDNLGNHIATQNLSMAWKDIVSVSTISVSSITAAGAGVIFSTHAYFMNGNVGIGTTSPGAKLEVAGQVKITGGTPGAGKVLTSDGAGLATWETVATPAGDNLGNHVATTTLDMDDFGIVDAGSITSSSYTATGIGIRAAQLRLANNVVISSEAAAALGGGVRVSTNVVASGFVYASRYLIGGSNALSFLSGTGSLGVGAGAGSLNTGNYNSFVGYQAGAANTTGASNSFTGYRAGYGNTTGYQNLANGAYALYLNQEGYRNTALGFQALYSLNGVNGNSNTAVGANALYSETGTSGGYNNTAVGGQALNYNNGGFENVAVGAAALLTNNAGYRNNAVGAGALYSNTSGNDNVAMGFQAMLYNQTGSGNTVIGGEAAYSSSGNSFSNTTILGYAAGRSLTNGSADNTFLGYHAGYSVTSGSHNVLVGFNAGDSLTAGWRNIIIGYDKDAPTATTSNHLNIGGAIYGNLSTGNIGIGAVTPGAKLEVAGQVKITGGSPGAGKVLTSDASGLATWGTAAGDNLGDHNATQRLNMGNYAIWSSSSVTAARYQINGNTVLAQLAGTGSLGVGALAGASNTGDYNTFTGEAAGTANTTGGYNSFMGYYAGASNSTGHSNSFMGEQAGYLNATGYQNSFFGIQSGQTNVGGVANTFMGAFSGNANTASFNSLIGAYAGYSNTTGDNNSIVGYNAGYYTKTGQYNSVLGADAGYGVLNNSFSNAVLLGYRSGYALSTGSDNILIGFQAGDGLTTGARNIVIGYDQDTSLAADSNKLNIGGVLFGDLAAKTIGISTRVPQAALDVVSTGTLANQYAQIWRNSAGTIVSSMTATGVLYPQVAGSGDNLGNHTATEQLKMGNYAIWSSSDISALKYQIGGVTVLSLPVGESLSVGPHAAIAGDSGVFVGKYSGMNNSGNDATFLGYQAGYSNSGNENTFVGAMSGRNNSAAYNNSFFGSYSGNSNTTGLANSFIGYSAGRSNIGGNKNSFLGAMAGFSNTAGLENSFVGSEAGYSNATGNYNAFFGVYSGYNNTASNNTFIGHNAGYENTAGQDNSYLGYQSGLYNRTGAGNAALGAGAGRGLVNNSFSSSTLVGYHAGYSLSTGSDNILLGFQAGDGLQAGSRNIILGYDQDAPASNTSNHLNIGGAIYGDLSTGNVGIGAVSPGAKLEVAGQIKITGGTPGAGKVLTSDADGLATWGAASGDNLGNHTATQALQMGAYGVNTSSSITAAHYQINGSTVLAVLQGTGSMAVGVEAGKVNTAGENTFVGYQAGLNNTTGNANSFAGYQAGYVNTTGNNNTFLGYSAGLSNGIGTVNTFVGSIAGYSNTSGSWNTFLGYRAGHVNTSGGYNSFLGAQSGYANTTGSDNLFVGHRSGSENTSGQKNLLLGNSAGYYNVAGSANSIVGHFAAYGVAGNSFSSATLMGYRAGYGLTTGSDNILLGFQAGDSLTSGTRNIIIGYDKDAPAATTSNHLNIGDAIYGDLSTGNVGIGAVSPGAKLEVAGQVKITGGTPGAGKVLTSDGVGLATWETAPVGAGDNLGNHVATTTLQMGAYGVNTSSNITAARYQINGATMVAVLPGIDSIAYGVNAGSSNITGGDYNTFIGNQAGVSNTTGDYNTANGYGSLHSNISGISNTANGLYALYSNTIGNYNTVNGHGALYYNTTGSENTANGFVALYYNQTGLANSVLGAYAGGYGASGVNSFSNATILGYKAGYRLATGSDNILLGFQAGDTVTTGARNIVVGYDQDTSAPGASNELNIGGVLFGDLSAGTIGISTRAPQAALDVVSTGTAAEQMAQMWRASDGVIKASMSATGVMMATKFVGDGSGLNGISATDNTKVAKAGDFMTGQLTTESTITVKGSAFSVGGSTLVVKGGNVGVGLADASARLQVRGEDTQAYIVAVGTGTAHQMVVSTSGAVGIGTETPHAKVEVTGGEGAGEYIMIINSGGKMAVFVRNK